MSWDGYLTSVKGTNPEGPVMEVAICGKESGKEGVWSSTPGLSSITPAEIKALAGTSGSLQACGPKIAGNKYMLVRDDTENEQSFSMIFSRRADGVENAVCVGRSKTVLVIAQGKPEIKGSMLVNNVFSVVKYLRDSNL
ncbi:profilin-1 [Symphorus nematophorus]